MKIKVKILGGFLHGRINYEAGQTASFPKSEADEMADRGMVELVDGGEYDPDNDLPSGDVKMEPITSNKMEKAPANKAAAKHEDKAAPAPANKAAAKPANK